MKNIFYISFLFAALVAAFIVFKPYPDSSVAESLHTPELHDIPTAAEPVTQPQETPVATPKEQPRPSGARVTVSLSESSYTITTKERMNAFNAMLLAKNEGLAFTYRNYTGLGAFIDSVAGTKAPEGYSWILLYKGATSTTGVSSLELAPGDSITWVLDKNK